MKYFLFLSLLLTTAAFAETPTKDKDVLWECRAETEEEGTVHGKYYSEYSEYTFQIFATAKPGVYLVKEGIKDMNAGAFFLFDKEWTALEFKAPNGNKIYQSQKNPSVSFTLTNDQNGQYRAYKKGYSSSHDGFTFNCENSPWQ